MSQSDSQVRQERLISIATHMLASQLGIDPQNIKVEATQYVEWSTPTLGLPLPPDEYVTQVITPGYRIILEYGNTQYEYHTDLGTRVVRYK